MNTPTRMQLFAAFAATTVLFAAGCDQRNADKMASTSTTPSTSATPSTGSKSDMTAPSTGSTASGSMSSPTASSAAAAVDDATITTKVKAAVMAEPGLKSTEINVDTKDGVVTLAGTVNSQDLKQRATQVAQQVQGVKQVSDQLVVKSS